ncbi:peptidyl-prolyl cis-trans isomerase-like [Eriocheir sinensis]|uniref:peptidyl-prolyl cis-trans isomerase-like n=1 Tax=Eriocheir sinensis TaxID=95602 RepID=UPI0021C69E69|nr:peptidyl-prolyl cis-trans isomerase-like [Eriocheir sinensis]
MAAADGRPQELVDKSRGARELLQQERFRVAPKRKEGEEEGAGAADCVGESLALVQQSKRHSKSWAEDFRSLTQRTRSLLQAGRVFAVHQVEGRRRHARISLEAGRLCLHALADHPLTVWASTLQVSQVVPPSPPCTVFLDLSWPGRAPRRVHIRLSPDTPWGRQFLMLCTGQRGPSYRGTRLYEVEDKGWPGECVWGGDYERNDGTGECVLLPGLEEGEERRPCRAGDVWGEGRRGVFGITTRDCQVVLPCCFFGEVVEGLHVVAEAAQHSDIKEVTVVDCGVVL